MPQNRLASDLDHVLEHTRELWDELRGERIFITGGTGFFGCWLLESFAWANDRLGLNATSLVLTRDPISFKKKMPHLAEDPAIELLNGNMMSFSFPKGNYSHIIHAASQPISPQVVNDPELINEPNVLGTRRVLEFANLSGVKKLLFTSSGAVYGHQISQVTHLQEDYIGTQEHTDSKKAYGRSKQISESICSTFAREFNLALVIARCFAFMGPYLPLDENYTIGNFIRDAIYIQGFKS